MSPMIDHEAPPTARRIIFAQTACGSPYEEMLEATDGLHRSFCEWQNLEFRKFIGIRRGFYPWHSTFNRILMLDDLLQAGFDGWFVYLDADAVVMQPQFDLRRYLGKRDSYSFIVAPGGPEWWDVNVGVFLLNFGHALGRAIAQRWHSKLLADIPEDLLRSARTPWLKPESDEPFPDDQHILQMQFVQEPWLMSATLRESTGLINNGPGRLIKQVMRVSGSFDDRLASIRSLLIDLRPTYLNAGFN